MTDRRRWWWAFKQSVGWLSLTVALFVWAQTALVVMRYWLDTTRERPESDLVFVLAHIGCAVGVIAIGAFCVYTSDDGPEEEHDE